MLAGHAARSGSRWRRDLCDPACGAACGRARPRGAGGCAVRSGRAAREPADAVSGAAWGAAAGDPGGAAARPRLEVGCGRGGRSCGGADGCSGAGLRSVGRAAAAGASVCAGWIGGLRRAEVGRGGAVRGACACCCAASHRRRRLVAGSAVAGPCGVLPGAVRGGGGGACAAAGAVRRLHAVAAGGAGRGGRCLERAVAAACVLEGDAEGPAGADRAAGRPAAAGGGEPSRRRGGAADRCRSAPRAGRRWRGAAGRACSWCCRRGLPGC